jgi:hypothetical protein
MAGLYSHTTRADGITLTAAIYNADHQNHIDNHIPSQMDDQSSNAAAMKVTVDPGEVGTESLATTLQGELERLRFAIGEIKGTAQWYETVLKNIDTVTTGITAGSTQTQAGATALTSDFNEVTVSGTDGDGVELPNNVAGSFCFIKNSDAAQTIQVWPASSDTVDGGSADAVDANALSFGKSRLYYATDGTDWQTVFDTSSTNATTITLADESSDTTCFPMFGTAATGDLGPKTGSNLTFNSSTGALGATEFVGGGAGITGLASGAVNPNLIINGGFDVWQRGTSVAWGSDANTYHSDRWISWYATTMSQQTFTVGQTDVPGNPEFYLRSAPSAKLFDIGQRIEGCAWGAGEDVTVSFYAKASVACTLDSASTGLIQSFGSGGSSDVKTLFSSFVLSTSWQLFTETITLPSISGKTVGSGNYLMLLLESDATLTGNVDIADVKVEVASAATAFEHESYGETLAKCQRYYERKTNAADNFPVAGSSVLIYTTTQGYVTIPYLVPKRTTPSIETLTAGDFYLWNSGAGGLTCTAINLTASLQECHGGATVASGLVAGNSSHLAFKGTNKYIAIDAEL